jgi:adenylosuccinate lyase
MAAVKAGGDRQDLHERIRQHSMAAGAEVKQHGRPNDLIARLKADAAFKSVDLEGVMDPRKYIGRSPQQVDEFVRQIVEPIRQRYQGRLKHDVVLKV